MKKHLGNGRAVLAAEQLLGWQQHSVRGALRDLEVCGILSMLHVSAKGPPMGGLPFSRGALFQLLRNRVYRGQIVHKGTVHEGEHEAIVDAELFDRVQAKFVAQVRRHRTKARSITAKAPLTGKLFDVAGETMSPPPRAASRGAPIAIMSRLRSSRARGVEPDAVQRLSAPEINSRKTGKPNPC